MKPLATLLAALCLAAGLLSHDLSAQTKKFEDPANLGDERVKLRDGRELPVDEGARGLEQMLRRLKTRASLMNIVAHPDDEDGGMLTLYSRGAGARVADLSLTRGEGGQNAVTGDFEDALGLLRTQELLACDRYSGIDQFFGTEADFGFSKTAEETFAKWTHERVLYDVVRAIRIYRPLVLTSTWIGGVTDGHGHHQVSGEIAQEAFNAAGDPKVFPELTAEGILPWQPLKIYARVPQFAITPKGLFDYATNQYTPARFKNYVSGEVTTTPPTADVVIHEGDPDALLEGQSYVQFARQGLAQQKSQVGPGMRAPQAGRYDVSYHRYGSRLAADEQKAEESGFFAGIDTSLEGIATLAPGAPAALPAGLRRLSEAIAGAAKRFNAAHPEAVAPELARALHEDDGLIDAMERADLGSVEAKQDVLHELRVKQAQLSEALALALGLRLRAERVADKAAAAQDAPAVQPAMVTPRSEMAVRLRLTAPAVPGLRILSYDVDATFQSHSHGNMMEMGNSDQPGMPFPGDGTYLRPVQFHVPATAEPTMPYFHRKDIEQAYYELSDPALRNAPETPPAVTATLHLRYQDTDFEVASPVVGVHSYAGDVPYTEAVAVVPPVSIASAPQATVLPFGAAGTGITATLHAMGSTAAKVSLETPEGWTIAPTASPAPGSEQTRSVTFQVKPPAQFSGAQVFHVSAQTAEHTYTESFRAVGYPGIAATNLYTPAVTRIVPVALKLPLRRRIGYLPGTGDAVPEALASIGLPVTMLTVADLNAARLKEFDTVILGVRTYAAHPDLHGVPTQALLAYARGGGNVVVQYQTAEFTGEDAPYPLTLGRDAEKVVDETAPVQILPTRPAGASLLLAPNRITPADFNSWVEERGHSFLRTWDAHYTVLIETHDPGEEPQKGGLVTVRLGTNPRLRGRWTYLAFAVYRQLPEAVPGAYRLFVDLLQK